MTNSSSTQEHRGYRILTPYELPPESAESLVLAVEGLEKNSASEEKSGPLEGRGGVQFIDSPSFGRLAVKEFRRGGLLGRVISRRYIGGGRSRAELEYDYLALVRRFGVSAPEPLAAITQGRWLYRTWLLTRRIEEAEHLSRLAFLDRERTEYALAVLAEHVRVLIEKLIFHVDLHPGNVLVAGDASVNILDFDKASVYHGSRTDLRDEYLRRWRRAVLKHHLPEYLSEFLFSRLCVRFDDHQGRFA